MRAIASSRRRNSAKAKARDRGGIRVRTHHESAEDLGRRRGLVAQPEDQNAGLDLLGREQAEAASLLPEFHLCSGHGSESNIGQSGRKPRVACLVKGSQPVVEKMAGGAVGDIAHLDARAGKVNKNGGVNATDVISTAGGLRSVGGVAEDNGIDLVWIVIVFLVGSGDSPERGARGTIAAGASGTETCMAGMTQGIKDRGERTEGDNNREQDGRRAERLPASDIEAGSTEFGKIAGRALLPDRAPLGLSRRGPGWGRSGEVAHTDSVDARPRVA